MTSAITLFIRDDDSDWPKGVVKVISGRVGEKECDPTRSRDGMCGLVTDLVDGYGNSLTWCLCQRGQGQGPILCVHMPLKCRPHCSSQSVHRNVNNQEKIIKKIEHELHICLEHKKYRRICVVW